MINFFAIGVLRSFLDQVKMSPHVVARTTCMLINHSAVKNSEDIEGSKEYFGKIE